MKKNKKKNVREYNFENVHIVEEQAVHVCSQQKNINETDKEEQDKKEFFFLSSFFSSSHLDFSLGYCSGSSMTIFSYKTFAIVPPPRNFM